MGKIVEKKKKKGRPSLLDLQKRNLKEQNVKTNDSTPQIPLNYDSATPPRRRSSRRYPDHSSGDNDEGEEDGSEEQFAGREKKMKVVLKLPPSQQKSPVNSDSNLEDGSNHKKRKIDSIGIAYSKKEDKSVSGANPISNTQGGQLDTGTSTALPDKKLLLFILERLQKKDTYGVFSEPVDPEELPDYHEVIEHPMDFGTIKKKLATDAYANLEQFEKDVFLVCSNAMQYNAPDTIYFRQARSIQEIAQKNFDNLRQDSDGNEGEPKVIRRGRPPTKHFKKPLGRPSLERASEFSSDAALATGQENALWSNHDTRKGSDKSYVADTSGKFYPGSFTENKSDRNDEGSVSVGYMMKHGKRHFIIDENRRNTYNLFHSSAARETSVLNTFDGERKQLLTVGVYIEHGYTRSLARYAANLGPVAWKIASKNIEKCLPAGVNFGPGWVGENDIPAQRPLQLPSLSLPPGHQISSPYSSVRQSSSATETEENKQPDKPEADNLSEKPIPASGITSSSLLAGKRSLESWNEKAEVSEGSSGTGYNITNSNGGAVQPRRHLPVHPGMNGYNNGAYGLNLPAHMAKLIGIPRPSGLSFQSSQRLDTVSRTSTNLAHPVTANSNLNLNDHKLSENSCTKNPSSPSPNSGRETMATPRSRIHPQRPWEELSPHLKSDSTLSPKQKPDSRLLPQQKLDSVPPDLNIRFQSPGSPSSNRADSAQPDLALQL